MGNRAYIDPFGVLGLPSTASKSDVKAAFRRMALRCHPDVDPSPQAAARFTEVKRATDAILKGHYGPAGPGPSSTYAAWQTHGRAAQHEYAAHAAHAARDWRPRSPRTAVWVCGITLIAGWGVFYGALRSHEWLDGYKWLTPERTRHPSPRRQQLVALMVQDRQERQAAAAAEAAGAAAAGAAVD